jgi:hypothetical protein
MQTETENRKMRREKRKTRRGEGEQRECKRHNTGMKPEKEGRGGVFKSLCFKTVVNFANARNRSW